MRFRYLPLSQEVWTRDMDARGTSRKQALSPCFIHLHGSVLRVHVNWGREEDRESPLFQSCAKFKLCVRESYTVPVRQVGFYL